VLNDEIVVSVIDLANNATDLVGAAGRRCLCGGGRLLAPSCGEHEQGSEEKE
jgi:hypothetical protein